MKSSTDKSLTMSHSNDIINPFHYHSDNYGLLQRFRIFHLVHNNRFERKLNSGKIYESDKNVPYAAKVFHLTMIPITSITLFTSTFICTR